MINGITVAQNKAMPKHFFMNGVCCATLFMSFAFASYGKTDASVFSSPMFAPK
jgi:hypothetical protein